MSQKGDYSYNLISCTSDKMGVINQILNSGSSYADLETRGMSGAEVGSTGFPGSDEILSHPVSPASICSVILRL